MRPKVILRHCESYNPQRIQSIILEGMDLLGIRPHGRTLVKPNLVLPHPRYFPVNHTRAEFMDGLLGALRERGEQISELSVGERCALSVPSRYAFYEAGYARILRKHKARAVYFDERPSVPFALQHPDALHPTIFVPQALTRCDFFVNAPKFKAHSMMNVTFGMKNYIGLQDDAYRLVDHTFTLAHKIADLQEILAPDFIAMDAILAGEYCEAAARPFPLHLIVMGANRVAADAVCTYMVGLDPANVDHIRLASERGYGPIDLSEIELLGDVSLAEAKQRCATFRLNLARVDQMLNGRGNITVHLGSTPHREFCPGGCPGFLKDAVLITEVFQPNVLQESRPLSYIIGDYQGEIHSRPGEKIVALGDCARWSGQVDGKSLQVEPKYQAHAVRAPSPARAKDWIQKSTEIRRNVNRQRSLPVVTIRGCPVPALENTFILSILGKTANPSLRWDITPRLIYFVLVSRLMRLLHR